MAPKDESAMLMQRMQDSNLCPLWRLTLINVRKGALTHRDVKNEGTSGDVYENKGAHDTMPDNKSRFWPKNSKIRDNRSEIRVFLKGKSREIEKVGACKHSAELSRRPATFSRPPGYLTLTPGALGPLPRTSGFRYPTPL
jgi:hypothetical protein